MTLDARMVPLALRLINSYGKTIAYSDASDSTYDPTTGTQAVTRTPYTLKAIVQDYSFRGAGGGFASGLIREGDKEIMIAASGLAFLPQAGDRVTVDSVTYTTVNVKTLYSGELPSVFTLHVKQ